MEQKIIFYLLSSITLIIITYQYFQYLKKIDTFTIQKLDGNIRIESGVKIKIGKKYTEEDAIVNSGGILRVNKIKIGNNILDESMFKNIKSFANIHRLESSRGDKLCLKDENGVEVCCSKEELGILTGQTPFNLKIADKKLQPSFNKKPINVNDGEYPVMTSGLRKTNNNSLFYDKKFVMIPSEMQEITKDSAELQQLFGSSINLNKFSFYNPKFYDKFIAPFVALYIVFNYESKKVTIPSDSLSLMIKVPGKNYFCNIENKSPRITLSNYELDQ